MPKAKIDLAIDIVQQIEFEVRARMFPAFEQSTFDVHPVIAERYHSCVRNVIEVYCSLELQPTQQKRTSLEVLDGNEACAGGS